MTFNAADPVFSAPAKARGKERRKGGRPGRRYPAPKRSARLYVYLDPSRVHLFRFFLEAQDNLGIMTVVDRWRAALLVRFSPHQEKAMREFLADVNESLPFTVAYPQ